MTGNAIQLKSSVVKHDHDAWLLEIEDSIGNTTAYRITDARLHEIASEIGTALTYEQTSALLDAQKKTPTLDRMITIVADGYMPDVIAPGLNCIRFQLAGQPQLQVLLDSDLLEKFKEDFPAYELD